MSNYNSLKTTINANIKQNGNQEITGQILNSVLNAMVNTLGAGYQFAGVATTATNPGSPDAKVFYIANGKGTYTNFGGLQVTEDEVVVLYWDSAWHKVATGIASQAKLSELESEVNSTKYSKNYPCVVELYINEVGKSADFANIHSLSLSQNTIKFTNSQGAWAGYSKIITTKDEIMAITPRGASDLSIIYGYVLIDWGKVNGDIDYITPIQSVAYNLDYSPSIKLYLEKGLIDEEFTAINSDIELIESDVDIIKKITRGEEIFVESKSEDVDGVIDFRMPIGDLFPLYVKIDKQSGSNKNFTIRAFNSKNASERQMIVETANFGEYYVVNPSFDTSIYDTLWLCSSKPSTIASSSYYSLYKSYTQENKKDVAPMSLDDFNANTIIKVLDINGGGNYTDFSQACEDLIANERTQPLANIILVIKKGDYIINPNTSPRQSGPILGCSIFAEKGARLICEYDGSSSASVVAFSPINIYAEVSHKIIIDGLEIVANNCRYCIHDEMGSKIVENYHHIFRNCKFTHKTEPNSIWASPRCVGGGLGNGGVIEIQNCEFESKINTSVDYHSGRDGGCTGSKVLIQNCVAPKNTFSGSTTQQPNANSKTIMVCSGNLTNGAPIQNNYQGRVEVVVINL